MRANFLLSLQSDKPISRKKHGGPFQTQTTMYKVIGVFALLLFLPVLLSCGRSGDDGVRAVVDSFSTAYFNWQLSRAAQYADSGSRRWLSYAASQVGQDDVDSLRAMPEGAAVRVDAIDYGDDDSTAVANVEVSHFLASGAIGQPPRTVGHATFLIPLACRNGVWRVALRELPRRLSE